MHRSINQKTRLGFFPVLAALCLAAWWLAGGAPSLAQGSGSSAGVTISNQATATYKDPEDKEYGTTSQTVTFTVRPVSGVTVTPDETAPSSNHAPNERVTKLLRVCNSGNFPDSYSLTRAAITSPAALVSLHFDLDASGTLTPADVQITLDATQSQTLAPGECVGVIAVVDTKDTQPRNTVTLAVTAKAKETVTANGAAQDDGAVMLAISQAPSFTSPNSLELPPLKLVENKERVVTSVGQTLNYLVAFTNRGAVPARNVVVGDDLPDNLEYIAGSLKLGTRALTDADDTDEGKITGRRIELRLREVAPSETVELRFQAKLTSDVLPGVGIVNTAVVGGENVAEASRTSEAVAVINPVGSVFAGHSAGAVRVSGARVVVSTDQAGNSPLALTPNSGSSPNAANENPFVTDAQGNFSFALAPNQIGNGAAPVTYFVSVTAPGYRARVIEVTLTPVANSLFIATVRALDGQPIARGGNFTLTTGAVQLENLAALVLNIPVFEAAALEITKVADRQNVQVGDALTYRIEARNATSSPVSNAAITDTLPESFHYVTGTARLVAASSSSAAPREIEPEIAGRQLIFRLGDLSPGARLQLSYRVRIGVNARDGEQFNSATISGRFPSGEELTTRPARAVVFVGRGILSMRQIVIGRVFEDANANGQFDDGERAAAGVRLYLSNGSSVTTDSAGLYSFPSVSEGSVVISLDPITVPKDYKLLDEGLRAGNSWTRLLRTPLGGGGLLSQNFPLLPPPEVRAELQQGDPASRPAFVTAAATPNTSAAFTPVNRTVTDKPSATSPTATTPKVPRAGVASETFTEAATEAAEPVAPGNILLLTPRSDEVVMSPALRVAAAVAAGWKVKLEVAGQRVNDSAVGEKREDNKNKITTFTFIGLNLRPGPNAVKATAISPQGEAGQTVELTVYGRGAVKRLEVVPERKEISAGGRDSTLVRVRAFDQWNHPAADAQVMVDTTAGRLLPEGCNPNEAPSACRQLAQLKLKEEEARGAKLQTFGAGTEEVGGLTSEQVNENVRQQALPLEGGEAVVRLISEGAAGQAVVRAGAGEVTAREVVVFTPELREAIMAGLAEVSVGRAAPENALFNRTEKHTSRINFFYRGSFLHRNLLTVAYDSARPLQRTAGRDRLFQLDPLDRLYPLFGDSSTRYEEAQSNSKLYARLDRGRSYALFGDFAGDREESATAVGTNFSSGAAFAGNNNGAAFTQLSSGHFGRMLTAYSRNLTGVKVHLANNHGDFITATGARPDTAFARDVFAGTSFGLLRLSRGEVLQGSETLVLEVRDRRNPDIVISREPLTRSVDYLLDPLTGGVFFLRPLSAFDYSFNLLQVVATYEYRVAGLESAVYTARASKRFAGAGLRVGASFVNQRQSDFGPYYVGGIDGEQDLPRGGKLFFEWGMTDGRVAATGSFFGGPAGGSDEAHNGHAYRAELYQPFAFREMAVRASFTKAGEGFFNPFGGTIAPGSQRAGVAVMFKARPSSIVSLGFADERNKTLNVHNSRSTISAAWTQLIGERLRLIAGYDRRDFNDSAGANRIQSNLVTAGVEWKATEKLNVSAKREQNLTASDPTYPNQTTVNATYQFSEVAKFFFSQRLASAPIVPISDVAATGFASLGSRQETAIGVETRLGRFTSLNSNYRIENAINGTDSFAVLGLTNRLPVNKKLSLDFGFERGFHVAGDGTNFNSANVGFAWQPRENFRSSGRYELRDRLGFGHIFTFGAAGKLSDSTSALGRYQFARARFAGRGNEATNATAALAYRPLESDRAALLFSYTRRSFAQEASANLGETRDRDDVLSSDGLVRLQERLELYGKFALRLSANSQPNAAFASTMTYLAQSRLQYRFAKFFDAAGEARWAGQPETKTSRTGAGAELGFWALPDLRLGVGYNFTASREPSAALPFSPSSAPARRGVYFTVSSKLSNLFNLFGTSRDGLITVSEAEERGLLADNFKPQGKKSGEAAKPRVDANQAQAKADVKAEAKLTERPQPVIRPGTQAAAKPEAAKNEALPASVEAAMAEVVRVVQVAPVKLAVGIGLHTNLADAQSHVAQLRESSVAARIVEVGAENAGRTYRVEAGSFASVDDAGRFGLELYTRGALTNFIIVEAEPGAVTAALAAHASAPGVVQTAAVAPSAGVATTDIAPTKAAGAKTPDKPVAASINGVPVDRSVREGDEVTLQFSSHRPLAAANAHLAELRAAGVGARIVKVSVPGRGIWFRVQAGRFGRLEDAAGFAEGLKAKRVAAGFIITRHAESE